MTSNEFAGKRGVIFIMDGWAATDHIDVWDGSLMKAGDASYISRGKQVWFLGAIIFRAAIAAIIAAMALVETLGSAAEDYRAGGYTFVLKQEAGRCVVSFAGTEHSGRLTLAPEPPCEFVRSESGGLKYFKYNDVGVDAVIIVIGSPLTDDERRRWKGAEGLFCGKTAQALLCARKEYSCQARSCVVASYVRRAESTKSGSISSLTQRSSERWLKVT